MNKGAEGLSVGEALSALADGEAGRDEAAFLTARWRDAAEVRAQWHCFQTIGDVMRSDELAGQGRDAEFLNRLRVRLAQEPVILAPAQPAAEPVRVAARAAAGGGRFRRWAPPAAMAAGFVMVAGAVLVMRTPVDAPAEQLAAQKLAQPAAVVAKVDRPVAGAAAGTAAETAAALAPVSAPREVASAETAVPITGVLLRDARMQQYFAAHQQFGGSTALGMSSAFLRNATFETPAAQAAPR